VRPPANGAATGQPGGGPPRPNIVVFYLDDVGAHDNRLWNDPDRTPAIAHTFVENGVYFPNAIGEDPLCCPGRGNLLTGLHTHNNGVVENNGHLFNPHVTIGSALQGVGYETLYMGKYFNFVERFTEAEWTQHTADWDHIQATHGYTDKVRTENGWKTYPNEHPTVFIAEQTAQYIRETDSNKPVFAVVAPFNLHAPNKPVPQPQSRLDKCDGIGAWKPPNYNEADVSDKPSYVRKRKLLTATNGYSMRAHCESMFGVDDMVQTVIDALEDEGRLDNTLLVFTADNGMAWGAHRLPRKSSPYSTPVPLFLSWPARWGAGARTENEIVSSIDLAPTFCQYAGCTLSNYATGQSQPDGVSYAGILDGTVNNLARDAVLETLARPVSVVPVWYGLRTTAANPLGLWHYVAYKNGERELYDLESDPYEMQNVVSDSANSAVVVALHQRLDQLLREGRVNRPDASLSPPKFKTIFQGYNVFDSAPATRQTLLVKGNQVASYNVTATIENNAGDTDSYVVKATLAGNAMINVRFLVSGNDVTSAVLGTGYSLGNIVRDNWKTMRIEFTVQSGTPANATRDVTLTVTSQSVANRDDVVVAKFKKAK
jgi:arylsulfatase A-like enzyme